MEIHFHVLKTTSPKTSWSLEEGEKQLQDSTQISTMTADVTAEYKQGLLYFCPENARQK